MFAIILIINTSLVIGHLFYSKVSWQIELDASVNVSKNNVD